MGLASSFGKSRGRTSRSSQRAGAAGPVEGLDPGVLEHYLARILEMEKKTWSLLL
ncbi:hypothetical protein [Thermus scotoductus]|uniref:hypothetical protein n=1 Tax=Thermus scotoductus TaxID=37636 RepID=UPI0020A50EEC|nr:hypothetical protein [Thermus scotoductus]